MPRKQRANVSAGERRASCRFPIQSEVYYKVFSGRTVCVAGQGKTIDMSSSGILFAADAPLPLGNRIELAVDWPAKLNETCRLKLVASGRIVRSEGDTAVIALTTHEFRTQGAKGLVSS